ncbi:MAG: hypothetical protein ACJ8C4_13730 [Gemmataceae bacterium]
MKHLAAKFWNDDRGALIASEYLFVITILIIGIIVGLTSLREAIVNELAETANAILALSQGYSISGITGDGGDSDGSSSIDTPSVVVDPTLTPAAIPSVIDAIPGN